MAVLQPQVVDRNGLGPTYAAADAAGDKFPNDRLTILHVRNGGTSAVTVTIPQRQPDNMGFFHDITVNVPAGTDRFIAAHPGFYNDEQGYATVSYSAVTGVTVAVLKREP